MSGLRMINIGRGKGGVARRDVGTMKEADGRPGRAGFASPVAPRHVTTRPLDCRPV